MKVDIEKELLAKFASEDNFVISMRLGKGIDWEDFQQVVDAIYALKNDSLVVSKELALLFVTMPRILDGGLGLYEGLEKQEILDARTKLYSAIYACLLP